MAPTSAALIYLDPGHTGGRDVASDILLPDALAHRLRRCGMGGIAALLALNVQDGAANDDWAAAAWEDEAEWSGEDWDDLAEALEAEGLDVGDLERDDEAALRWALAEDADPAPEDDEDGESAPDLVGLPWVVGKRRG